MTTLTHSLVQGQPWKGNCLPELRIAVLLLVCVVPGSYSYSGKSYNVRASGSRLVFLHLDPFQYAGAKLRSTSWVATENWLCTVNFFFSGIAFHPDLTVLLSGNVLGRAGGFLLVDLVSFSVGKLSAP